VLCPTLCTCGVVIIASSASPGSIISPSLASELSVSESSILTLLTELDMVVLRSGFAIADHIVFDDDSGTLEGFMNPFRGMSMLFPVIVGDESGDDSASVE